MKRLGIILLLLAFTLAPHAQQKRAKKSAVKKTAVTSKSKTGKKVAKQPSVQTLQNQRQQIQKRIKEQEQRLRNNERDVKRRLQNLMVINTEIEGKRRTIDTIKHDISNLDIEIEMLGTQLEQLQEQLNECKKNYVKSMRYMHRNRSTQSQLMFIFSADNLTQMYRRLRFMREYAAYQRTQGDAVKAKEEEVNLKFQALSVAQEKKRNLLSKGEQERRSLEGKQTEQQNVVNTLQKEQKTIQNIIAQQKKKDAALNAQIDRLIAEEVARAKARAEAEAKRKAAAEAEKKRKEELARKKAEAERIERENKRRIAEAKAKEERLKAEARAAERKERKEAERRAREAERERLAAERRAAEERRATERELAAAKRETAAVASYDTEDRRLSSNFESNRGRFPMPISGSYQVVNSFGQYDVEGLKNVRLDNKGVNLKGQPGAQARCIFNGEVSMVFSYAGIMGVIVRHGSYFSVYGNLSSVSVSRGQTVNTGQALGTVGGEGILQFQLRKGKAPLNPMQWLRK